VYSCADTADQRWNINRSSQGDVVSSQPLTLRTDGEFGEFGAPFAVENVEDAFAQTSGSKDFRHRFHFNPTSRSLNGDDPDTYHVKDHIQTFARLSGNNYNTHFLLTRSARSIGDGAFYVAYYDDFTSNGDAWKFSSDRADPVPEASQYVYHRMAGINHAGGAQVLGQLAFVAGDCDDGHLCDAYVGIFDLRDVASGTGRVREINRLTLDAASGALNPDNVRALSPLGDRLQEAGLKHSMQSRGPAPSSFDELTPGQRDNIDPIETVSSRAAAVAATQLEDGRYLLFVRGREVDQSGWFFISETANINTTRWRAVDFWTSDDLASNTPWYSWESVNFIVEKDTGKLFMLAFGTNDNKSFLYEVEMPPTLRVGSPASFNFRYVDGRGLNTFPTSVNTRWGAGMHVTPDRKIVTYVTGRGTNVRDVLKLNEFRYRE
jgi:hypothetical protein